MMKRLDFATSRVKKRCCLMLTVRSSSSDRDESTYPSGTFNIDRYNSLDERLRLNHLSNESSPPRTPASK